MHTDWFRIKNVLTIFFGILLLLFSHWIQSSSTNDAFLWHIYILEFAYADEVERDFFKSTQSDSLFIGYIGFVVNIVQVGFGKPKIYSPFVSLCLW